MFGHPALSVALERTPSQGGVSQHSTAQRLGEAPICVICPAYNADQTLSAAVASVRRQTCNRWKLIIIDDGSTDETFALARSWAKRDGRITVFSKPNEGVAAARNYGAALAQAKWLLFLDADDTLGPGALERLLRKARAAPDAGVVLARAARVDAKGKAWPAPRWDLGDPFSMLAYECGIVIHSALVKRDLALRAGGFDPALRSAEDWDFWQRLARMGVRFAQIEEVVAFYRSRPGSLSKDTRRLLQDTLCVMRRGVAADPRVTAQKGFEDGAPRELLDGYIFNFALWSAAREIAAGRDGVALLRREVSLSDLDVDAQPFADMLANGMADFLGRQPHDLASLWEELGPKLVALLSFAFPGDERMRSRELVLLHIKNRCGAAVAASDAHSFRVGALHLGKAPAQADALAARFDVLQLWAHRPIGLFAIGGRAHLGQCIPAQIRKVGLRPALAAVRPWRRARFWRAMLAEARDTAAACSRAASAPPDQIRALVGQRARFAIENGLSAVLASDLGCRGHRGKVRPLHDAGRPYDKRIAGKVPILMYHRVGCSGGERRRYALRLEAFREQIGELAARGYRSVSTQELGCALRDALPLPGRPIMLTFDDGYADFPDCVWPILRQFGFSAVVFPVTEKVGGLADWDLEPAPLMDWGQLRALAGEGVEIGSHSQTHRPLTRIALPEVLSEARGSAEKIAAEVGCEPRVFCFPFGARDILVDRVVAEAGYELAMSCRPGFCTVTDDPVNLPRIEIAGWDSLDSFRRKLRLPASSAA